MNNCSKMKKLSTFAFIVFVLFSTSCKRCIECTHVTLPPNETLITCKDDLERGTTMKEALDILEQSGYECETFYD